MLYWVTIFGLDAHCRVEEYSEMIDKVNVKGLPVAMDKCKLTITCTIIDTESNKLNVATTTRDVTTMTQVTVTVTTHKDIERMTTYIPYILSGKIATRKK